MSLAYYEQLAPWYRLIYADWDASAARQAMALDSVIREWAGADARRALDAACGIGTQALGLAALGYQVTALDLAPRLVAEARREAAARGLAIEFGVADMRWVGEGRRGQFDVVIACDNAVPHLADAAEIAAALRQFRVCLRPGGVCLVSVRDWAATGRAGTRIVPRLVHERDGIRTALFDVWRCDGDHYDFTTYIVEDDGADAVRTHVVRGGRYFCVELHVLERLMREAGFVEVAVLRDRFFQPLLVGATARRAAESDLGRAAEGFAATNTRWERRP